jgi:hypothetical protein
MMRSSSGVGGGVSRASGATRASLLVFAHASSALMNVRQSAAPSRESQVKAKHGERHDDRRRATARQSDSRERQ